MELFFLGTSMSGKSCYCATLVSYLRDRIFQVKGVGSASPARTADTCGRPMSTSDAAQRRYGNIGQPPHALPNQTPAAATSPDSKIPLTYSISFNDPACLPGERKRNGGSMFMAVYDAAGEDCNNVAPLKTLCRYVALSDGLVLFVDPLESQAVARQLGMPTSPGGSTAHVLTAVTQAAGQTHLMRKLHRKRVAVVFTKGDLLARLPNFRTQMADDRDHENGFDEVESLADSDWLRGTFVNDWGFEGMARSIENALNIERKNDKDARRIRYFCVSALGGEAVPDPSVPSGQVVHNYAPWGVLDPILWHFREEGLIPNKP